MFKGVAVSQTELHNEIDNKDIYLDRDLVKKQIAARKHICGGCENYQENFDCPYWKKCNRAYEIGKKAKK